MDVEAGIERLFGLAPEEFVAARDELARRLRKDGDGAAAKRVAGLRRPTVAAWAVNRAARRRPELVTDLIEAGERLRQAQRRALSGLRGGALRTAGAERRVAIERLLAEAADVLDREVAAPSGFGEVAGLQLVQPAAAEPEAPERPARPARRRVKLDPARRRELEAARRQRDQRRREARAAAKTAGKAREAADQAAEAEAETTEAARRARPRRPGARPRRPGGSPTRLGRRPTPPGHGRSGRRGALVTRRRRRWTPRPPPRPPSRRWARRNVA